MLLVLFTVPTDDGEALRARGVTVNGLTRGDHILRPWPRAYAL